MPRLLFTCLLLATAIMFSCEKKPINAFPIAKAGIDLTVVLPVDSVTLNGSASYDPDGQVLSYTWAQLSGPASANILTPNNAKARAHRLQQGVYLFELIVKDNVGLLSKDTVVVTVQPAPSVRIRANAGPDQEIDFATNQAILNATASADSSGLLLSYQWRQIAGPTAQLQFSHQPIATAVFFVANTYQFELKVWNSNGEAFDTMQVTVKPDPACTVSRTEVPAQLTKLTQFPFSSNYSPTLLAVGNKLIITVDIVDPIAGSYVIIYNTATGTYIQKELSYPRTRAAKVVAGNKVFFAGGFTNYSGDFGTTIVTDVVDIYDAASDTWSVAKLSQARGFIKAGVAGNKVVFAGGLKSNEFSRQVDVYDLQTAQWTTSLLAGEPRVIEKVVANGSNVYFIGGLTAMEDPLGFGFGFELTTPSKTIDIYHVASGTCSLSSLQVQRYGFAAVLVNNKILIAGGVSSTYPNEGIIRNVEIITLPTMQRSTACLANATAWHGVEATALKNGTAIFYSGRSAEKRKFDIYDSQTGTWSLGVHNSEVLGQNESATLATLNNQVYVLKGNTLFTLHY